MTPDKLFNSFCLEGKITEQHAEEIKSLLTSHSQAIRERVEKSKYKEPRGERGIMYNAVVDDILALLTDDK